MTPLEIMAKAAINKSLEQAGRTVMVSDGWPSPEDIAKASEVMRAALLALAEAPLPTSVIGKGAEAIVGAEEPSTRRYLLEAKVSFRAMLRAIAGDA